MTKAFKAALADDLATEICKVLDIEANIVGRMLIDLEAGQPVKVYLFAYADKAIQDIDWARFLTGAEVKQESWVEKRARQDAQWAKEKPEWPTETVIR
jgi:hypothetical protein